MVMDNLSSNAVFGIFQFPACIKGQKESQCTNAKIFRMTKPWVTQPMFENMQNIVIKKNKKIK